MGNTFIGNINGKLANGNPTVRYVDTTTLSFNYTGGNWIFSLTNISPEVQRLIDYGYKIEIQVIRPIGQTRRMMFGKDASKLNPSLSSTKKSNSFKWNITDVIKTSPQSMNLNTSMAELLQGDQSTLARNIDSDYFYTGFGNWYRTYRFCLLINNVSYQLSGPLTIYTYASGPVNYGSVSLTYNAGTLSVNPL